jgi:ferredoxin
MHRPRSLVAEELSACIRCNECLVACPALGAPLPIEALNNETLGGPLSPAVARFARACYLCGACVPVCPVGLHRDAMMLWLKMRLLAGDGGAAHPHQGGPVRQHLTEVPLLAESQLHAVPVAAHHQAPRAASGRARTGERSAAHGWPLGEVHAARHAPSFAAHSGRTEARR